MTLPVYPSQLTVPLRTDYGLQHVSPFEATELASGRSRSRRVFRTVPSYASVVYLFRTDSEAAFFEAWFRDVIADGTEWFEGPLKSPIGLKNYECKFAGMYEGPALVQHYWRISARLELRERPLLPAGWGNWPAELVIDAPRLDVAVNQLAPEA